MTRPSDAQRLAFLTDAMSFSLYVAMQYGDRPNVMERLLRSVGTMHTACARLSAQVNGQPSGGDDA